VIHEYAPGATPLDPDEAAGLIPSHITTQGELNAWELANILEGEQWAFGRTHSDLLTSNFVRRLDPANIAPMLHELTVDVAYQAAHGSYALDEIAARYSHRLVKIHPFANGNGRLSRTAADLLLVQQGAARFSWGASDLVPAGEIRDRYLIALRAADAGDYAALLAFVRS
jgi:hypothetical protein